MSVTPFTPLLPPVSPTGGAATVDAVGTPGAEGFAALVAGLLAAGIPSHAAAPVPDVPDVSGAPAVPDVPGAPAVPVVPAVATGEPEAGPEGEQIATDAVAPEEAPAATDLPAEPTVVAPLVGLHSLGQLAALVPAVTPAVPAAQATTQATTPATTPVDPDGAVPVDEPVGGVPTQEPGEHRPEPLPTATERPAVEPVPAPAHQQPAPAAQAQPSGQTHQVSPVQAAAHAAVQAAVPTAVHAAAPAAAATPAAPTHAPSVGASPVVQQVLPEVARLASSGNGTHRLTMTLKPEALGEVRITLTVRGGEVRVRLAAGEDAQRALAEGAPELRRVLELAGARDTAVVVRDLAGGLQQAAQASSQAASQSASFSSGSSSTGHGAEGRADTAATGQDRDGSQNQHAGTRGGTTARDGLSDGAATPRHEPARRPPSAGVDLTM